jgi:hypothetical protein
MESRANSPLVVKTICLFFFDEILSLNQQFRQKRYWLVQERVYVVLVSLHFRKKGGVADNIFSWGNGSNPQNPTSTWDNLTSENYIKQTVDYESVKSNG